MVIKEYIIKIDEDQSKKDIYGGYPLIEPPLELVMCKDCAHAEHCGIYGGWDEQNPDWFCADGEKKSAE